MHSHNGQLVTLPSDPLWYKDAIIYELHVRAFYDHDGDGIGDFQGLTEKLDYLQDLGVTALWLLPFYPSPLRDDGYDTADYTEINPIYGSMRDFRAFLRGAHERGLRVITELVINHTSDQHHWFQRSRRARPGSSWRDFYVWTDTPNKYQDARIIFKDFEPSNWTFDREAQAYYWHRFYSHQPDLNFDNPRVRRAVFQVMDRWLDMGVDGFRLDAIPYLFEREGTNCENLPETHAFLRELRKHIDDRFSDRLLLAEANQWPEDAIAYFGEGNECHTAFHFPLMPRLFMATQMEDRFPIVDILQQTPAIPANCQWALFLRNHDELTLEMVTDEERDYMYRVYAHDRQARINLGIRRRLAPLLGNNRRKIELMHGLLFSLPGTPVLYYGDEIGMGDNIYLGDRNGVRTPMQWSPDRNAGFSKANSQRLFLPPIIDAEYHFQSVNVETQRLNPESLLWWTKRLIALRQRHPVFGRGTLEFLFPDNAKVLAFVRSDGKEDVLVVANLSRFAQCTAIDLSRFDGQLPVEMFGRTPFAPISKSPYYLTLSPHAFYWFAIEKQTAGDGAVIAPAAELPLVRVEREWTDVFRGRAKTRLEALLRESIRSRRWFGGKSRPIQNLLIVDSIDIDPPEGHQPTILAVLRVDYATGEPETYILPIGYVSADAAAELQSKSPQAPLCRLQLSDQAEPGVLYDALWHNDFPASLLDAIQRRRRFRGRTGELIARSTKILRRMAGLLSPPPPTTVLKGEQSNSSLAYGDQLIFKLFRRVEAGINPDLEVGRFLTQETSFMHVPPVAGSLEYRVGQEEPLILGILSGFVTNQGTAWQYTLETLARYFEHATVEPVTEEPGGETIGQTLVDLAQHDLPQAATERLGAYRQSAELLGQRTAELHLALAGKTTLPDFVSEPFTQLYQRSLYQSTRKLTSQTLASLRRRVSSLSETVQAEAKALLDREADLNRCLHSIMSRRIHARRQRIHGDYHLGQVLYTGNDFVIIDFEGEPTRSLGERRMKRSPIRDVAGMIRSFHYAAYSAYFRHMEEVPENRQPLRAAARYWYVWASVAFLKRYLEVAGSAGFMPPTPDELKVLLNVMLLEKSVYELSYELNHRPDWVEAPLLGIHELLDATQCAATKPETKPPEVTSQHT
ncbi:MAG TPA: maltose alpha-D-glucosyltransferase [Pirellulales bacterium]|nr:maltose alpha-D-glucosyltransferase [Pirellulales bacterium]